MFAPWIPEVLLEIEALAGREGLCSSAVTAARAHVVNLAADEPRPAIAARSVGEDVGIAVEVPEGESVFLPGGGVLAGDAFPFKPWIDLGGDLAHGESAPHEPRGLTADDHD
jgi:hypothetical protein